ncbi:MAG: acetolactate synthase large subunit [Gammaproteobacteria bacterium]|nr:acetolactate synthase large subunit [Gammaproteobacteria bacterium]
MNAAELFVRCLENEGVEYIFGIPGEENLAVMDAMLDSRIRFITTRHEQGAAFMADVYGRLTGKAGVCLSTLGPGATNLVTGVADANMDHAPVVAIAGQAGTTRLHKESHQVLDLVNMFRPLTKYAAQILEPEVVPEIVRKAFKISQVEKPGACFIDFPENVADMEVDEQPLHVQSAAAPAPALNKIKQAAKIISEARFPLIMAGNGVVRARACQDLMEFAEKLNIPVATTFMAKGSIPSSHDLSLGTVGLQSHDYVSCGFDRADVIICVGYDIVEYHPYLWHKTKDRQIIHIDSRPAEVDAHYIVAAGIVGDIGATLHALAGESHPHHGNGFDGLRNIIKEELKWHADEDSYPVKPQRIIRDLRKALDPEDIAIVDVGAHKMWMARMYQAERPNTCIISNGFASMGIAVPGAMAAKLAYPGRKVVAVTGDAGFLMNSQEIETAMRENVPMVILVWNDSAYGLIEWKQNVQYGRPSHIKFTNPDLVMYAESFGAKGYRIEKTEDLLPTLEKALADNTVSLIDCPVDYSENMELTAKLGEKVCPV